MKTVRTAILGAAFSVSGVLSLLGGASAQSGTVMPPMVTVSSKPPVPSKAVMPGDDRGGPAAIRPPVGSSAYVDGDAVGVQIYHSERSGTTYRWVFDSPSASLFSDADEADAVVTHYGSGGPTWQDTRDGSAVVGEVVASVPSQSPNSIPQLLLKVKLHKGKGMFSTVTYIQRLNTVGGLPPIAAPTQASQEAYVPYTAKYSFYVAARK